MIRPVIFVCLVLAAVAACTARAVAQQYQELPATRPATQPRALVELQAKRDAQREELESQLLQRFDQLRKDYAAALDRLQASFQTKGNLEGVLAVRAEHQRLQAGATAAPGPPAETPAELRSLQQSYQQAQDRILKEQQAKVDALLRAYVAGLKDLQKTLTTQGDLDAALAVRAEAQQFGGLDAGPAPAPGPRETPAIPPRSAPGRGLQLRPQWDQRLKDPTCSTDAALVFSRFCQPGVNLEPAPDIELVKDITYLMPLDRALAVLGKPAAIRRPVGCTSFPRDSFFYHTVQQRHPDGFSLTLVVTDQANQVVGIQFIEEAPQRPPTRRGGGDWREDRAVLDQGDLRVYDFIRAGTKASGQLCVRHTVTRRQRVLQVDTELISWRTDQRRWRPANENPCTQNWWDESDLLCKERIRLILAQPVAELILQFLKQ